MSEPDISVKRVKSMLHKEPHIQMPRRLTFVHRNQVQLTDFHLRGPNSGGICQSSLAVAIVSLININNWPYLGIFVIYVTGTDDMNVMVMMLESVSRLAWLRHCPEIHDFITKQLGM